MQTVEFDITTVPFEKTNNSLQVQQFLSDCEDSKCFLFILVFIFVGGVQTWLINLLNLACNQSNKKCYPPLTKRQDVFYS